MRIFFLAFACPALAFQGYDPSEGETQLGLSDDMGFSMDLYNSFFSPSASTSSGSGSASSGSAHSTNVAPQGGAVNHAPTQQQMCTYARGVSRFDNEGNTVGTLYYSENTTPGFGDCYTDNSQAFFKIEQDENGKDRAYHSPTPQGGYQWHLSYCDLSVNHCMSLEEWGGSTSNNECGNWGRPGNPDYPNEFDAEWQRVNGCLAQCRSLLIETESCNGGFTFHDNLELSDGSACDTHCGSRQTCYECSSNFCTAQSECGTRTIRFGSFTLPIPDGFDVEDVYAIMQDGSLSFFQKLDAIRNLQPTPTPAPGPVLHPVWSRPTEEELNNPNRGKGR